MIRPLQLYEIIFMIKKVLLATGIAATLTCAVSTVFADGLTLVNNTPSDLAVICNGIPGTTINANSQLPLPWLAIPVKFHSIDTDCQFNLTDTKNTKVGSAHIAIDVLKGTGTVSKVWSDPSSYTVTADHSWDLPTTEMTVSIGKI